MTWDRNVSNKLPIRTVLSIRRAKICELQTEVINTIKKTVKYSYYLVDEPPFICLLLIWFC